MKSGFDFPRSQPTLPRELQVGILKIVSARRGNQHAGRVRYPGAGRRRFCAMVPSAPPRMCRPCSRLHVSYGVASGCLYCFDGRSTILLPCFHLASAYNGTPQAAMPNENKAAGRGPTRSVRAAQRAKTTKTAGPHPKATVTQVGPGTRKGRGSFGSVIRSLTRATNSSRTLKPHNEMSTVMSRSNFNPRASDQPTAQSKSETHGTAFGSLLVSGFGSSPSQAIA